MQKDGRPLRGVVLVVAATFVFAVADTLGKHLAMLYAVTLVLAARYTVNFALVALAPCGAPGAAGWSPCARCAWRWPRSPCCWLCV